MSADVPPESSQPPTPPVDAQQPVHPSELPEVQIVEPPPAPPSVFTQPKVASALGIVASIVVHAGLVIMGILLIPPIRDAIVGKGQSEQTIVPIAELATEQVGGIPNPGLTTDRDRAAGQTVDSSVKQSDAWADRRSATLDKQLMSRGSGDAAPTQIGIGGAKSAGQGLGNGVAGGGGLAKFGVPGGGSGIGPRGAVFGNGGNAYRIVFVCDGTGDMVTSFSYPVLLRELQSTMAKLKPKQSFNVVFFYDGTQYSAVDKDKLMPAIPANFDKLRDFLDHFSGGKGTDPRPAITFAFSLKPELIYFLSNGNFSDLAPYDDVVAQFKKLNVDKKVRVNTVLLTSTEDNERPEVKAALKDAADTMAVIAKANGGTFNSIDARRVYLGQ